MSINVCEDAVIRKSFRKSFNNDAAPLLGVPTPSNPASRRGSRRKVTLGGGEVWNNGSDDLDVYCAHITNPFKIESNFPSKFKNRI